MGGGEARGEGEGGKSWAEGEKRGRGREPFSVCSSHLGDETRKKGVEETEKEKTFWILYRSGQYFDGCCVVIGQEF